MAKVNKKSDTAMATAPGMDDRWQLRDDVDTILKHQELRENKKRYSRASTRLKSAARSCGAGMRCPSR